MGLIRVPSDREEVVGLLVIQARNNVSPVLWKLACRRCCRRPRMFLLACDRPFLRAHSFRRRVSPGEPDCFPESSGINYLHIVPVRRRTEMGMDTSGPAFYCSVTDHQRNPHQLGEDGRYFWVDNFSLPKVTRR